MDAGILVALLMFGTLAAAIIFAIVSKRQTQEKMEDDSARKSRLAKNAPNS